MLRFRWSRLRRRYGDGAAAIDEAIARAAPWRWRTGRLNQQDDEMDDGSSSGGGLLVWYHGRVLF